MDCGATKIACWLAAFMHNGQGKLGRGQFGGEKEGWWVHWDEKEFLLKKQYHLKQVWWVLDILNNVVILYICAIKVFHPVWCSSLVVCEGQGRMMAWGLRRRR